MQQLIHLVILLPLAGTVLTAAGAQEPPVSPERRIIVGRAVFPDDQPLVDTRLEFQGLDASNSESRVNYYCQTDNLGAFQLEMSSQHALDPKVVAEKWIDGDRLRWRCEFLDSANASDTLVKLVFENRGRIIVRVFGLAKLPDDYSVFLHCTTPGSQDQVNIHRQLQPGQHGLEIHGLEPRDYQLSLHIPRIRNQSWTALTTVPAVAPFRGLAKIQLPDLQFGTLRAQVTLPDGTTPASQLPLWIEAERGEASGKRFVTDVDGILIAHSLPVGPVRIRCIDDESIAPTALYAEIAAQATTDLGKRRLQAATEVYSWLTGTLLYQDGSPIPKVDCVGWQDDRGYLDWTAMDALGVQSKFEEDGTYRVRFSAGKHRLKLEIEGSAMRFQGGGFLQSFDDNPKCILVDVDTLPGQTIRRDIVLNKESSLPATAQGLRVDWSDKGPYNISLFVEQAAGVWWATQVTTREQQSSHTFENVPHGVCLVLLRGMTTTVFQGQLVTAASQATLPSGAVHFLQEQCGSLRIEVPSEDPSNLLEVELVAHFLQRRHPVFHWLARDPQAAAITKHDPDFPHERQPDGSWLFDGMGPGEYTLTLRTADGQSEQRLTLAAGEQSLVEFATPP